MGDPKNTGERGSEQPPPASILSQFERHAGEGAKVLPDVAGSDDEAGDPFLEPAVGPSFGEKLVTGLVRAHSTPTGNTEADARQDRGAGAS